MRSTVLTSLFVVFALAAVQAEESTAWMILAEQPLAAGEARVEVPLNGLKGSFDHLRLGAVDGEVHVGALTVHFGNGETHTAQLDATLAAGGFSAGVELPSALQRTVVRLDLAYRAAPGAKLRVYGAADRWSELGRDTVGAESETHTIQVGVGQHRYDRMRLAIEDSGLWLLGLTVHYAQGDPDEVKLFGLQGKNALTRVFDLTGGARVIARVELRYKALNPKVTPPTVIVFAHQAGQHEAGSSADDQVWQPLGQGWAPLAKGEATIGGLGLRGVVNTQLKFVVEGAALEVREVTLVFGNKEEQTVAIGHRFEPGEASDPIALDGQGKRMVTRLVLRYAPQRGLARAKVRVLGQ